ncbi:APOL3, partial [Symbiodinium sp. CCMP2456]
MTYSSTVRAKELLGEVISITALLTDDEALRLSCGFTVEELLAKRRLAGDLLRELAEHLDRVCRDTGIARTTGGGTAILGGVLGAAGLVLAPVSGGTSMTLSLTGAGLGVGAAAATLTAAVVKDAYVKGASKRVKETLAELQTDDAVLCRLVHQLQANAAELIDLCCK